MPGKGGHSGLMPSKLCDALWREGVRGFMVFEEQGAISLWTVLGLVGTKVKFQASSAFWFQLV